MSVSNNKKKNNKILVLVLTYAIIAIFITSYMIWFYNENNIGFINSMFGGESCEQA